MLIEKKSFDIHGYLSEQAKEFEDLIYSRHKIIFDHAYELNAIAQRVKHSFTANNQDGQQTVSVSVYTKIMNSFQAVLILARKGLRADSEILVRVMLEALFILKLLCTDEAFHREYINRDSLIRRKLINAAKKNDNEIFEATRKLATEDFMEELEAEIQKSGVKEETVEALARRAGMSDLYDSVYRLASEPCHVGIRSLTDFVKADAEGNITEFNPGPFFDVDTEIVTATNFMIAAIEFVRKLFKIEEVKELDALVNRIMEHRKQEVKP